MKLLGETGLFPRADDSRLASTTMIMRIVKTTSENDRSGTMPAALSVERGVRSDDVSACKAPKSQSVHARYPKMTHFESSTMSDARRMIGSGSAPAAKKLVIKLNRKSADDVSASGDSIKILHTAVASIFARKGVDESLEYLYRLVESLCLQKRSSEVYSQLVGWIVQHLNGRVQSLLSAHQVSEALLFLEFVNNFWQDFCMQLRTIRSIFLYMDRTYLVSIPDVKSLWLCGLQLLRNSFQAPWSSADISPSCVQDAVIRGISVLIEKDRNGEDVPYSLMKSMCKLLLALNSYSNVFEQSVLLPGTRTFYRSEAMSFIQNVNQSSSTDKGSAVVGYLNHVIQRVNQENERISKYLEDSSRRSLMSALENELIEEHSQLLIDEGVFIR
jgi:cullin-4